VREFGKASTHLMTRSANCLVLVLKVFSSMLPFQAQITRASNLKSQIQNLKFTSALRSFC
jgi:hypothetical protein